MKVKLLRDLGIMIVTSGLSTKAIKDLEKHNPNALQLVDDNNEVTFRIGVAKEPAITNFGICFNKETVDGMAVLYLDGETSKEDIAEKYSVALNNLNKVEDQARAAYETLQEELFNMVATIEEEPEEVAE